MIIAERAPSKDSEPREDVIMEDGRMFVYHAKHTSLSSTGVRYCHNHLGNFEQQIVLKTVRARNFNGS